MHRRIAKNRSMFACLSRFAILCGALIVGEAKFAPSEAAASDPVWVYEGRCFYADRYAPLLEQGVVFANCDEVHFVPTGKSAIFNFRDTRRGRDVAFRTERDGEKWRIEAIRLRRGEWRESKGECTFYRVAGEISTITCITARGTILYAANLEVARSQ